jgi:hypothetical protein
VKVPGGVETTEVSPEVARLLKAKGIPYATEVTFEVLDASGKAVLKGRSDYFFRDPRNGAGIFGEVKGIDLEALTPNQKVYVPLFEKEGARIRITSNKGGALKLPKGSIETVRGESIVRIGRGNLKDFADALEQITTGEQVKFSWRDAEGLRFFKTEAEFDAFLAARGIQRVQPLPAKPAPEPAKPLERPKPPPTDEEAVAEMLASRGLRLRKQGGFATVGGMLGIVLLLGTSYLYISDIRHRGFLKATRDLAAGMVLFKGIQLAAAQAGVRIGFFGGLGVGLLLGLPDDQGPAYHEAQEQNEVAMRLLEDSFPGVVAYVGNEYCLQPFDWPCIEVNSPWEIRDAKRFSELQPQMLELVKHPWVVEAVKK